ncbi:radical SAM protein [Candidatus Thorarchaeota archaeon]|nr:MAG: radical SAM protein [Candidatus Thorarchaeota archaeon]
MIAYGPVPSRRLGRSLGINNIPAKSCTYSCTYCQLGRTTDLTVQKRAFYPPEQILEEVRTQVRGAQSKNEAIDYLTFVPDGEPTLDINLGTSAALVKEFGIPIAILTNSSLLWDAEVRLRLHEMDLVSLKVDAVTSKLWHRVNRPHGSLDHERVLDGIRNFCEEYEGRVFTETMLVNTVDYTGEFERIAAFLSGLDIDRAYIAIPTRPPAEDWVAPAGEEVINRAFQTFADQLGASHVEYLIGYEGNEFASTGDPERDLLSITSVHPMRDEGVQELLSRTGSKWSVVQRLIDENKLVELEYGGTTYYMRAIPSRTAGS